MQCTHGERNYRSGEKNGKPWAAWFCPSRDKSDQCKPEWVKQSNDPVKKFDQGLDAQSSMMDQKKKGEQMGRNNIAHAMIRAGKEPTMQNLQEAEKWFRWSRGDMSHV